MSNTTTMINKIFARAAEYKKQQGQDHIRLINTSWFEQQTETLNQFSYDQLNAINETLFSVTSIVMITGDAGTGKTRVLKFLESCFTNMFDCAVANMAPTGIASQNIDGRTISSAMGLRRYYGVAKAGIPNGGVPYTPAEFKGNARKQYSTIANYSRLPQSNNLVLLVDEFSMISAEQFEVMLDVLGNTLGKTYKVVLFGDPKQLAPVELNKCKINQAHWIWENPVWLVDEKQYVTSLSILDKNPKLLRLVTIHRQKENLAFAKELTRIGYGKPIRSDSIIAKRLYDTLELDDAIHLFASNAEADHHNQRILEKFKAAGAKTKVFSADMIVNGQPGAVKDYVYRSSLTLTDKHGNEYIVDKHHIPAWIEGVSLRPYIEAAVGMKFIVRVNQPALNVYNGTIGTIVDFDYKEDGKIVAELVINVKGETIYLNRIKCLDVPTDARNRPMGELINIPGHTAHAITVDKSQGCTFDCAVVVHLPRYRAREGWLYVGLSRVTTPELLYIVTGVSGQKEQIRALNNCIKVSSKVLDFLKRVKEACPLPGEEDDVPFVYTGERTETDNQVLYHCVYRIEDHDWLVQVGVNKRTDEIESIIQTNPEGFPALITEEGVYDITTNEKLEADGLVLSSVNYFNFIEAWWNKRKEQANVITTLQTAVADNSKPEFKPTEKFIEYKIADLCNLDKGAQLPPTEFILDFFECAPMNTPAASSNDRVAVSNQVIHYQGQAYPMDGVSETFSLDWNLINSYGIANEYSYKGKKYILVFNADSLAQDINGLIARGDRQILNLIVAGHIVVYRYKGDPQASAVDSLTAVI